MVKVLLKRALFFSALLCAGPEWSPCPRVNATSWLLAPRDAGAKGVLRCFRRHEEMAVRMALARATHHAVQRHQCTQTATPAQVAEYIAPTAVNVYVAPPLAATCAATAAPAPVIEFAGPAPTITDIACLLEPPVPLIQHSDNIVDVPGVQVEQVPQVQIIEKIVEIPKIQTGQGTQKFHEFGMGPLATMPETRSRKCAQKNL